MKEIMLIMNGTMNIIIKMIRHHFLFIVCSGDALLGVVVLLVAVFQGIFSYQKFIHILSPQYGHCITLLSSALLHLGQSL